MVHTQHQESQALCPACDIGPFTRNHYFTGKLLLERDFSDEQRYYIEKLRHHHQRLHGWGVVCGLKVTPHPQEACRDRFVCIEPGTAIDCCGHEIVVRDQECLDITRLEAIQTLIKQQDKGRSHVLQVCLRYRECPTEEIPVLYDECGCDDTRCAPNRILESYDVDVIVDPKEDLESFGTPKLKWENTVAIAHATRVALHDATHRLYVMTADNPAIVYQVSTDNHVTITASTLPAQGVALAVSNDGARLYVIAEPTTTSDPRQLHVLDTTTQPGLSPVHPPIQADLGGGPAFLAVTTDNHLLALGSLLGDVLRWDTDIDTAAPLVPPQTRHLGTNLSGLVLSSDGNTGYVADPTSDRVLTFDTTTLTPAAPIIAQPADARPTALAIVSSTGFDLLAVADQINKKMHLLALTPPHPVGSVDLDHAPVALVASPGGHWVYVLEQDATGSYVQSVSIDGLQLQPPVKPSAAFQVGNPSQQFVLSKSGTHLYIPFTDDPNNPALGGVAIVEVSEQACSEILWRHLDGCPHCDIPNCVVLATIENYHLGDRIEEQTDPPADSIQDATDKIARLDNRKGRRLLPSTQILMELIQCLLEHGTGGAGAQGLPGKPGEKGDDGNDGAPGPGLEEGLTRISALSWVHNTAANPIVPVARIPPGGTADGIVIGFTAPVFVSDPNNPIDSEHIFQVLIEHGTDQDQSNGFICRCPIRGDIIPVEVTPHATNKQLIIEAKETSGPKADGVAFIFHQNDINSGRVGAISAGRVDIWIILRGDFVVDALGRAIDAEFVRADLSTGTGDRPINSPFGVQGGLFESWTRKA